VGTLKEEYLLPNGSVEMNEEMTVKLLLLFRKSGDISQLKYTGPKTN
jgi:hypothetical protein